MRSGFGRWEAGGAGEGKREGEGRAQWTSMAVR